MRKYLVILVLFLACSPVFAAKKKYVDPRDTLQYSCEFNKAGKQCLLGLNFSGNEARIYTYKAKKTKWAFASGPLKLSAKKDSVSFFTLGEENFVLFSYLDTLDGGKNLEWTLSAVSFDGNSTESLSFTGKALQSGSERFRIEGSSNFAMLSEVTPLATYLDSLMRADSRLVELPEDVYLTDKTVEWWLENNPNALGSAKKVNIGSLPKECSAVAAFKAVKNKEKNSRMQVASVDLRGYTLVIVHTLASDSYSLVWAEPVCRNKKTDRRLMNVYFEDANTLAMVYYKGSSMFKYRINLASGALRRS